MTSFRLRDPRHFSRVVLVLYAAGGVIVGTMLPRFETRFLPELVSAVNAQSAIAICSSIASGMIALTGIVFSLTFVMVQFSASAYSPRLVLWVARDPVLAHALGVFTTTFLYALTLLAWIDRDGSGKMPFVSAWVMFVLLLASMALFVGLIERVSMLQVGRMLVFTGDQGRAVINSLYPPIDTAPSLAVGAEEQGRKVTLLLIHTGRPAVICALRTPELVALATEFDAVFEVMASVGDTLVEGMPMLKVCGGQEGIDEKRIRAAIVLGDERTFEQDPKYAIRLVVDIGIKALSAAINDPTTAVQALDQIEDLLVRLGRRRLEIGAYRDGAGVLRLTVPFPTWEDFLRLAFDEIQSYGSGSVQVMRRMKALLQHLIAVLPVERQGALRQWERRLRFTVERSFEDPVEQRDASVGDRQGLGVAQDEGAG